VIVTDVCTTCTSPLKNPVDVDDILDLGLF